MYAYVVLVGSVTEVTERSKALFNLCERWFFIFQYCCVAMCEQWL